MGDYGVTAHYVRALAPLDHSSYAVIFDAACPGQARGVTRFCTVRTGCNLCIRTVSAPAVAGRFARNMLENLVGVRGFEPPTPASRRHGLIY